MTEPNARLTREQEFHSSLCSQGIQAGDQTMPCDCTDEEVKQAMLAEIKELRRARAALEQAVDAAVSVLEHELLTPKDIWAAHVQKAIDFLRGLLPRATET